MSKFLNTLIIGVASGAAAAYFFTTEKGKAVKARIDEEIASFKEDPKAYQNQVVEKASDYKDLAVDTFQDYKTKFENGDITADDLFLPFALLLANTFLPLAVLILFLNP